MADIHIDRQLLVSAGKETPSIALRLLWALAVIAVVAAVALVGFKLGSNSIESEPSVQTAVDVSQIQQQLDDIQTRLDNLEKHRRVVVVTPPEVPPKAAVASSTDTSRSPNSGFSISSASSMQPETDPTALPAVPANLTGANAPDGANVANHEAWEATTNRLADVVGAVGSQQGELTQTRDQVTQLEAQTRRTATQFELRRGTDPQLVGPVSLLLKDADFKKQRYTVCVYVSGRCVELKDRAVDEVVVFALSHDHMPLDLIATKVTRDGIVGYLEIPANK